MRLSDDRLPGWLCCDAVLFFGLSALMWLTHLWHAHSGSLAAAIIGCALGFVAGFILCFAFHEWGHWLGARLAGVELALNDYWQAIRGYSTTHRLIPDFDGTVHSPGQFLWMSWGSVLAYLFASLVAFLVHVDGVLGVTGAAFSIGVMAFTAQSLALDMPVIVQVMRGAEVAPCFSRHMTSEKIKRRTIYSLAALAVAVIAWNLL